MKISCAVHCLELDDVEAAMGRLDEEGVLRVPYTCQISGQQEEILLFGHILATRLSLAVPETEDADGARMLAGLYAAELCVCDVAILCGLAEDEVCDRLQALTRRGLLAQRKRHGMRYFRLASEEARHAIAALLPH